MVRAASLILACGVLALTGACDASYEVEATAYEVVAVISGDTVDVSDGMETVRVRLLGVDAPEVGECGFERASEALLRELSPGAGLPVYLTPNPEDGSAREDEEGSLLRYVVPVVRYDEEAESDGVVPDDTNRGVLESGLANAGHDSRDGHDLHPQEDLYHELDDAEPEPEAEDACPARADDSVPFSGADDEDDDHDIDGITRDRLGVGVVVGDAVRTTDGRTGVVVRASDSYTYDTEDSFEVEFAEQDPDMSMAYQLTETLSEGDVERVEMSQAEKDAILAYEPPATAYDLQRDEEDRRFDEERRERSGNWCGATRDGDGDGIWCER